MLHSFQLSGLDLQTGDIICTMNGKPDILPGEFWRLVGRLVPGEVDHVAMYLGPGGVCVEVGLTRSDPVRGSRGNLGGGSHGSPARAFVR